MGLLTEKERSDFSWELRFKSTPQLKQLFNELTAESKKETNSDFTRGQASEKASMVKTRINLRNMGGDLG
jgi:hypothetical protein